VKIAYKNNPLERVVTAVNVITGIAVIGTFILLYGLLEVPAWTSPRQLHIIQIVAFWVFLLEKAVRFVNAASKREFFGAFWIEIPLLLGLLVVVFGAGTLFHAANPSGLIMTALGVYLVYQVVDKLCRNLIGLAATGRNPMRVLAGMFIVLIVSGAGLLMLPKSHSCEQLSFVDALFTATSASCVTGLVINDTGRDFTLMGQTIILTLIQLGGLGIVIFGVVLALLLRQALSIRESVAMQDLFSSQTVGRIGRSIGFIFGTTMIIELTGAILMIPMWNSIPVELSGGHNAWFASVFHSISAFCNAGFGLASRNLVDYDHCWQVYGVIAPLIILGGLGFGVMENLVEVAVERIRGLIRRRKGRVNLMELRHPARLQLQTKLVLVTTIFLIVAGTAVLMLFEYFSPNPLRDYSLKAAYFQSVTSRTAGFNSVDIAALSEPSKLAMILLMFVGGSPGSTAGGIKTVTLAVLALVVYSAFRRYPQVQAFRRAIRPVVVGKAVTVVLLYVVVIFVVIFAMTITERGKGIALLDLNFEVVSAIGTVGISTGITPKLSDPGKILLIITMLIGRLGPLSLLAAMTFNQKTAKYEYPSEPLIVG
jgi:trk system potassium uptake protein